MIEYWIAQIVFAAMKREWQETNGPMGIRGLLLPRAAVWMKENWEAPIAQRGKGN